MWVLCCRTTRPEDEEAQATTAAAPWGPDGGSSLGVEQGCPAQLGSHVSTGKFISKCVIGCLIWFLCRVELYVICLGVLTYSVHGFRILSKVIYVHMFCPWLWCSLCTCILHFYICICSAQLSMSYVEKHLRNKIIIINIVTTGQTLNLLALLSLLTKNRGREGGGDGGQWRLSRHGQSKFCARGLIDILEKICSVRPE